MVPPIVPQVMQTILGSKPSSHIANHGFTVPNQDEDSQTSNSQATSSTSDYWNQLAGDALSLIGLGASAAATSSGVGAAAYAAISALVR